MRNKKIVALNGGIGNQMFQYAFAMMLESEKNSEIEFDIGFYRHSPDRSLELTKYNIGDYRFGNHYIYNLIRRVFQRIPFISWIVGTYKEYDQFVIDHRVYRFNYKFYYGYWQNLDYYTGIEDILRERFRYTGTINETAQRLRNDISSNNSVAVHIRRGDYLSDKSIYRSLDKSYYIRAIDRAYTEMHVSDREKVKLYFFSNDIEWCRDNFGNLNNAVFVDNSISGSEHIDMMLMRCARCLIMANSTFSWWAAWLSERQDKIVIAPDLWFDDPEVNAKVIHALISTAWIVEKV